MRSRSNTWVRHFGVGSSAFLLALSLSGLALAQGEAEGVDPLSPNTGVESSGATAPAPTEPPGQAPEAQSEADFAPSTVPAASARASNEERLGITVRMLGPYSMPENRVRGITGGSLWLTTQGLQWPYQPKQPGGPSVALGISGSVWVDTAYARIESGSPESDPSLKRWTNQGRGVLRATPAYSTNDDWFVQGQLEYVANGDQILASGNNVGAIDDLFVRVGKWGQFDITVGRFQGWEVYHYGMGLDLNTLERRGAEGRNAPKKPPQIYGLDYFWDRANYGAGKYAIHYYPTDYLRFEVLGQIGTTSGGSNQFGLRPVGILDLGLVKVKAGFELGSAAPQQDGADDKSDRNGAGGSVQLVLDPHLEAGVNGAVGYVDSTNVNGQLDEAGSTTTTSLGGFANGRVGPVILGAGVNYTTFHTLAKNGTAGSPNFGRHDEHSHLQAFFAVQYGVWDRLFVKFVAARAVYDFEDFIQDPPHPLTYKLWGGRLRVMYLF